MATKIIFTARLKDSVFRINQAIVSTSSLAKHVKESISRNLDEVKK